MNWWPLLGIALWLAIAAIALFWGEPPAGDLR
jgi:hypothetical protein